MGIGRLVNGKFNLLLSVRHDADQARLDEWRRSFERASELLHDATDGQHQFGDIFVVRNSGGSDEADGWLLEEDGRSRAHLDGLGTPGLHMTLFGDERHKPFVVVHEFMHYAYGVRDEYVGPGGADAECTGDDTADVCVMEWGWWEGDRFGDDADGGALVVGRVSELCVDSNHDPDGDSLQADPCWTTMNAAFSGLAVPTDLPDGATPPGHDPITWTVLSPDERFVLLIDRSGSMAGNKLTQAKFGGGFWADQMLDEEWLAVVGYATTAADPAEFPIRQINGPADRDDAEIAIDGMTHGGRTAIGDALRRGLEEIQSPGGRAATQVIVLLTDGIHNEGEDPVDVVPDLLDGGVRVFTIGVGASVNTDLLFELAEDTGGQYHPIDASLTPSEQEAAISQALDEIAGTARANSGAITTAPEAIDGSGNEKSIIVDEGSDLATFAVSWPQATDMLFVELTSPSGDEFRAGQLPQPGRELGGRRRPWHGFHVFDPEPGEWKMRVVPEVAEPGSRFRNLVFARNAAISGRVAAPGRHQPGDVVPVEFVAQYLAPLSRIDLSAEVREPDGTLTRLQLDPADDHEFGCGAGRYVATIERTKRPGKYRVRVNVRAVEDRARIAPGGERANEEDADASIRPVTFERTFETTVRVGDEHGCVPVVEPSGGAPGESLEAVVTCEGARFRPDETVVEIGDGVDVRAVDVTSPSSLVARLEIARDARPGPRAVRAWTPGGSLVGADDAFVVAGDDPRPTVEVRPVGILDRLGVTSIVEWFRQFLCLRFGIGCPPRIVLVRHADYHGGPGDPGLNAAGLVRRNALAHALERLDLRHVIVSQYRRTQETAEVVAAAHGLTPQVIDAGDEDAIVSAALQYSGTVLIVGHSNTVPSLIGRFGDAPGPAISPADFDDLFVVDRRRTIHLQYGA